MALLRPRVVASDAGDVEPIAASSQQGPLGEIVKWIPVEVIAFYEAVMAAIPADKYEYDDVRLWLTLGGLIVCGLWIAFATKPETKGVAWRQVILAMLAFVFWATGIQSDVLSRKLLWEPWVGTIVLLGGTMLLPIFDGILTKLGIPQNK